MRVLAVKLCFLLCSVNLCSGNWPLFNFHDSPTPKMLERSGSPVESHEVVTEDGFILTLHRIPGNKTHGYDKSLLPVFLQHGLFDSSADWIIRGPPDALPYLLANKGYDVWLGNIRGNVYSRKHKYLKPSEQAFWDWSWHEMGIYDIPASVDYILNVTGHGQLTYVGHSMGTTMFFVMCSMRPEYNEKINQMIALAPVAFISHTTSPIRYLVEYVKHLKHLTDVFGTGEFIPRTTALTIALKEQCTLLYVQEKICEEFLFIFAGHDPSQFDLNLLPVILGHTPAGTSTKTIAHYTQEIKSAKFCQFDYGKEENLKKYNSRTPPNYDLSKITAPVSLHYADNDLLAQPEDVKRLYDRIRNKVGMFRVNYTQFNHLDFLWARDVKVLVNDRILELISRKDDIKGVFTNFMQITDVGCTDQLGNCSPCNEEL